MTKEEMADKLATLVKERDDAVMQANQVIAYLNGKIELLTEMLATSDGGSSSEG